MVQTFLLFYTITNEKTVKFMQRDIITSTITWHLGLVGSNNFGEYTSFSPFTLGIPAIPHPHPHTMARSSKTIRTIFMKLSEIVLNNIGVRNSHYLKRNSCFLVINHQINHALITKYKKTQNTKNKSEKCLIFFVSFLKLLVEI